jgi:tRNA(Ile)-lysidine synthase
MQTTTINATPLSKATPPSYFFPASSPFFYRREKVTSTYSSPLFATPATYTNPPKTPFFYFRRVFPFTPISNLPNYLPPKPPSAHLPQNAPESRQPSKIQSLPTTLLTRVAAHILRHHMLTPPPQRIGVAVSAGADSVVLLHMLHQLRSHFACHLHVLHVNHHLRAAASDADESFVLNLAAQLGLPITVDHAAPPATQIEQQARHLRRAFFQRAMQEHNLQAVALGHTRGDQAETVLFRLLRGSGLTGLAGMRPVTEDRLIRPLLTCTRDEVRAWATAENIPWRDDASNLDTTFTRNRLRLETLPSLANTYNPNLEALLAQSADLAQTEEDYWHRQIAALYPQLVASTPFGLQISVPELLALHLALRRRLLRRIVLALRGDLHAIEFEHIESILRLCQSAEGHDRVIIPGVDALRSFNQLLLSKVGLRAGQERNYQLALLPGQEYELPFQNGFLSWNRLNFAEPAAICANFKKEQQQNVEICDWDGDLLAPSGTLPSLYVRNWRPGDLFQQTGHHSDEKIKTLFQSAKVLLWQRKHWPVVVAGDKIVWVRQFGGSASVTAAAASRNVVRLVYRKA